VTDRVVLELLDDGVGIELPIRTALGLGLINLRDRAEKLGGTFEIHPREGGGTRLVWSVPIE
jgi:signal transduction histidine kinase